MSKFSGIIQDIRSAFGTDDFIPLHAPLFCGNEKKYVNETIDSTFVSSVGSFVNTFEIQLAKLSNTSKAVAVVNGTAGLQIALKLVGVKTNEEVITQALTFVATANAIAYNGADPIFVDVDLDTMGLSPNALQFFLDNYCELRNDGCYNKKTGKRIGACVPMNTFGFMCRMDEIIDVCSKWNIPVVEDSAEALGSKYKGKNSGTFGDIGVFSFNGNKIITAGGGGALISKNEDLMNQAKHSTTTSKIPHPWEYSHDEIGFNYRMPNLNAALLCAQLENLPKFIENKKGLFKVYSEVFKNSGVALKPIPKHTTWNHWLMSLEFNNLEDRNDFLELSNANGIMTRPIWRLMYKLPIYAHCYRDEQINAEFLESRIVNIPSSVRIK